MTRILLLLLTLEPDSTVRPCGNAACVSTTGTPVTLGGTVQANRGNWPDGGIARLVPIVPGASLDLTGIQADPNDGGTTTTPDVIIQSINTRSDTATILSVKNRQNEVFSVKGNGATAPAQVTTHTLLSDAGYFSTLNTNLLDAGSGQVNGALQVLGTIRLGGDVIMTNSDSVTSCPLDGGSPSQCDATVRSGSACGCFPVGSSAAIAAGGCAVHLVGTTVTCTSANTLTNNVNIFCF